MKEYTIKNKTIWNPLHLKFQICTANEWTWIRAAFCKRIRSDRKREYIQKAAKRNLGGNYGYDESGNEKAIFCGILSEFSASGELDGCVMDLLSYTGSKLMDVQKHQEVFKIPAIPTDGCGLLQWSLSKRPGWLWLPGKMLL